MRQISGFILSLYGIALSFLFIFSLFWDNKGAKSIWDKSTEDWITVGWFGISLIVVFYGAFVCMSNKRRAFILFWLVVCIVTVNIYLFVLLAQTVSYFSVPHLIVALSVVLWGFEEFTEQKQNSR